MPPRTDISGEVPAFPTHPCSGRRGIPGAPPSPGMGSGSAGAGAAPELLQPFGELVPRFRVLSQNPPRRCCGCSAPGWGWSLFGAGSCRRMNSPGSELSYSWARISESLLLTLGCVSSVPFPPNTPFPTANPCFQTTGRLRMRGKKNTGKKIGTV